MLELYELSRQFLAEKKICWTLDKLLNLTVDKDIFKIVNLPGSDLIESVGDPSMLMGK
jgi:hypothetical protein